MAYNTKKGKQQSGDVQFEGDPTDTQIDFENDFVAIKTNAQQRFIVSGSFITSLVPLSCSVGISAGSFDGDSLTVGGSTIVTVAKQLQNIASLDATTEATIESAIDTMANLGSMGGAGTELEALGSLDVAQGLKINNVNFVDASRNITGSGLLTNLAGVTLDAGARIGVAGDTDLMTLTANTVDISGRVNFDTMLSGAWASTISAAQITASLGITGSALYTDSTTIDTTHLSSSLNISGSRFYGDGSRLSGIATGIGFNGSTANGLLTYGNSTTADVESALTFVPGAVNLLRINGRVSSSNKLEAVGNTVLGGTMAVSGNVNIGGPNLANSSLYVKAASDNSVVSIFKSPSDDCILAITGSGQVVVGGVYTGAKLNVTGTESDMLIQAKSYGANPIFYVSGSGELWNSGSVTLKTVNPTIHLSSSLNSAVKAQIGLNSADNILIQNGTVNKHIVFKANDNGTLREGFRLDGAVPEVVVNQTSDSLVDFRVESDNQTHMLYVEGAADKVGINTNEPTHTFSVNGATSISGSTAPTVLEVTGASNSKLILARSDMTDPAFYVSGSGDVFISGSLRTKQFSTTIHNFNNSGLAAYYIPFMSTVEAVSPTYLDHMIAPADGRLVKAFLRIDGTQSGSVTLDVHATDLWQESIAGSPSKERVTRTITHRNNTYMFPTSGSVHFSEGDIVGVRIDPHASSSNVNVTCVWEYDYRFA